MTIVQERLTQRLLVLIISVLVVTKGIASLPQVKSYDQQKDLIDGRINSVSITWDGKLLLAPSVKQIFLSERPFIWDFVFDAKGNLFVATGDGAKVFHINPDGKSKMISQWENQEVYALALDNAGNLYVGTSPDGKIYRIKQNTQPEMFADLKVKYIWDILFDKQNNCYVATGDSGAVYLIDNRGEASIFYRSEETHIRCLAWDNNDRLLAGSYQNGYLYRISSLGQAFVVYDSEFEEIHQICVAQDGTIYAAGLGQKQPKRATSKESERINSNETTLDISSAIKISSLPVETPSISKSGIIKVQPDGVIKNIWQQNTDHVQSIVLMRDQSLLVGTGDKGRLYKINTNDESTYLLNLDASQVTSLKPCASGKIWVATSNLGEIFQLEPEFEKNGFYESEIFDAQTSTHWGTIQWEQHLPAGCNLKMFSRTGNTGKPNSSWSRWSILNNDQGIKNPDSRFIQWKLELTTNRGNSTPEVKNIKLSYLQQNLPPEIKSIRVHQVERQQELQPISTTGGAPITISLGEIEATGEQRQLPQPSARRQLRNGYRRVTWKASDQNKDRLSYDLYFQEKSDKNWWELKKELSRASHTWNSRMMPDGIYRLKVIADDHKSNPINTAKQTEKISDWFIVDNTGPKIEQIAVKKNDKDSLKISFKVIDELSPIHQVQICYDLQNWLWVYPSDRVSDTKQEDFRFVIRFNQDKFGSVIIKAQDSAKNVTFDRVNIKE